jgi:PAS domain S-box-containing protein
LIGRESSIHKNIDNSIENCRYPIEEISEPICKININGTILYANKAFKSRLMFSDIDLYEKNFFEVLYTKTVSNLKSELLALKKGEVKTIKAELIDSTSNEIDANLSFRVENLVDDKPHTIYCFLGKVFDLHEETHHNIYQSLFREAGNGMAVEHEDKIILANDSFAELFGYETIGDLEDKNILELVAEEDVSKVSNYLFHKKTGKPTPDKIEFLALRPDRLRVYIEFNITVLRDNEKLFLAIYALDVSERQRTKRGMLESEQRYRNLTENINDFLYTFERVGKYFKPIFFTEAVSKITGYTQEEFLGDPKLFLKVIHPDDFPKVKERVRQLLNSDLQTVSEMEFRIINKEANIVWVRNKINVIRDDGGKIVKVYGLVSDVTLNKRAEEELKQSADNLKKLNDAKDRFLSIISHDLRTPFSSILGFTDLLLEDDSLSNSEKKQYISYIQESSKSMLSLVNSLLEWTRLQTGRIKFEPSKMNAKEIIDRAISTVSGSAIKKGVEINNRVDSTHNIFADKNLVLQVFNNLLSNAVKFTKRGDGISINVQSHPRSRFLKFSVKDTGIGIKQENLDKLFNVDTKFTSEGTAGERGSGLGLSLVKEIIDKHGGTIEVFSEYSKGSEFIFTLPIASTKILLVDNNKRDRLLYSKILMNIAADYAVDTVSNGSEALERIATSPPALIITEHQMPVMNGYTLIKELIKKGLKSSIPVIVLSGKIERSVVQEYSELGIEHIFTKPVNLKSFKEAIDKSIKKGMIGSNHST